RASPSGSLSPTPVMMPTRRMRSASCVCAATGQAANPPPSSVTNSRRLMCCPQSGDGTLPYRGTKYGVVHHGRFWPLRSEMGQKRLLPQCTTDDCFAPISGHCQKVSGSNPRPSRSTAGRSPSKRKLDKELERGGDSLPIDLHLETGAAMKKC